MEFTGHLTEAVYRRYDSVNEADLRDGVRKLAAAWLPKKERQSFAFGAVGRS